MPRFIWSDLQFSATSLSCFGHLLIAFPTLLFHLKQNILLPLFALESAISFFQLVFVKHMTFSSIHLSSHLHFSHSTLHPSQLASCVNSASCEEIYCLETRTCFTAHPYPSMPKFTSFNSWVFHQGMKLINTTLSFDIPKLTEVEEIQFACFLCVRIQFTVQLFSCALAICHYYQ